MSKAYWISDSDVRDMDALWRYREANREVMNRYGGKFIVMHGQHEVPEGEYRPTMTVVEFPTYQAAVDCYHHPDYQAAAKIRHAAADGNMIIVEGFDMPDDF